LIAALLSGGQIDSRAATPEVVATMPDVLNINASMAQKSQSSSHIVAYVMRESARRVCESERRGSVLQHVS
jgi:hypothetical protein